jgi:HPt (histidine-containing phosphotransfer) domain-containing protein
MEVVGDDPETLREIVVAFLEDAPERLSEITHGLAEGDPTLVRRAAHTLKSNAETFGALSFADACRRLEETAKEEALDDARRLAAEIEHEWAVARPEIESLAA